VTGASLPYENDPARPGLAARVRAGLSAGRGVFWTFLLSYVIAAIALWQLVVSGGTWDVLSITRILYPLSQSGVVAFTDADEGFFHGVPDPKFYVQSQDAVSWGLVALAAGLFVAVWLLKALQFHQIAASVGAPGGYGPHARAYLYGRSVGRLFPFGTGQVASAAELMAQGVPRAQAAQVVWASRLFLVFETVTYALVGLWLVGINRWLSMLIWPLIILAAAYIFLRPRRDEPGGSREWALHARRTIAALNSRPGLLPRLAVLSLLAFFLIEVAVYVISQAFTGDFVIINVPFKIVMMGVVGGYLARLVAVTPGGIGQWEWGFAMAVYAGGLGMPEAVSLALLVTILRYAAGTLLMIGLALTHGVKTNLGEVLTLYRGQPDESS
jgi:hypothetical protein